MEYLDVSHSEDNFDGSSLFALAMHCKLLKFLNLSYCTAITDGGLKNILRLPAMEELIVVGCTGLTMCGVVNLKLCFNSLSIVSDFSGIDLCNQLISNQRVACGWMEQ